MTYVLSVSDIPINVSFDDIDHICQFSANFCKIDPNISYNVWIEFGNKTHSYVIRVDDDIAGEDIEFEISIQKNLSKEEIIRNISHEYVHISQILNGKLILGSYDKSTTWQNKIYKDVGYYDLPWEIEAYKLEEKMIIQYYEIKGLNINEN